MAPTPPPTTRTPLPFSVRTRRAAPAPIAAPPDTAAEPNAVPTSNRRRRGSAPVVPEAPEAAAAAPGRPARGAHRADDPTAPEAAPQRGGRSAPAEVRRRGRSARGAPEASSAPAAAAPDSTAANSPSALYEATEPVNLPPPPLAFPAGRPSRGAALAAARAIGAAAAAEADAVPASAVAGPSGRSGRGGRGGRSGGGPVPFPTPAPGTALSVLVVIATPSMEGGHIGGRLHVRVTALGPGGGGDRGGDTACRFEMLMDRSSGPALADAQRAADEVDADAVAAGTVDHRGPSGGLMMTGSEAERLAGRGSSKKWKISMRIAPDARPEGPDAATGCREPGCGGSLAVMAGGTTIDSDGGGDRCTTCGVDPLAGLRGHTVERWLRAHGLDEGVWRQSRASGAASAPRAGQAAVIGGNDEDGWFPIAVAAAGGHGPDASLPLGSAADPNDEEDPGSAAAAVLGPTTRFDWGPDAAAFEIMAASSRVRSRRGHGGRGGRGSGRGGRGRGAMGRGDGAGRRSLRRAPAGPSRRTGERPGWRDGTGGAEAWGGEGGAGGDEDDDDDEAAAEAAAGAADSDAADLAAAGDTDPDAGLADIEVERAARVAALRAKLSEFGVADAASALRESLAAGRREETEARRARRDAAGTTSGKAKAAPARRSSRVAAAVGAGDGRRPDYADGYRRKVPLQGKVEWFIAACGGPPPGSKAAATDAAAASADATDLAAAAERKRAAACLLGAGRAPRWGESLPVPLAALPEGTPLPPGGNAGERGEGWAHFHRPVPLTPSAGDVTDAAEAPAEAAVDRAAPDAKTEPRDSVDTARVARQNEATATAASVAKVAAKVVPGDDCAPGSPHSGPRWAAHKFLREIRGAFDPSDGPARGACAGLGENEIKRLTSALPWLPRLVAEWRRGAPTHPDWWRGDAFGWHGGPETAEAGGGGDRSGDGGDDDKAAENGSGGDGNDDGDGDDADDDATDADDAEDADCTADADGAADADEPVGGARSIVGPNPWQVRAMAAGAFARCRWLAALYPDAEPAWADRAVVDDDLWVSSGADVLPLSQRPPDRCPVTDRPVFAAGIWLAMIRGNWRGPTVLRPRPAPPKTRLTTAQMDWLEHEVAWFGDAITRWRSGWAAEDRRQTRRGGWGAWGGGVGGSDGAGDFRSFAGAASGPLPAAAGGGVGAGAARSASCLTSNTPTARRWFPRGARLMWITDAENADDKDENENLGAARLSWDPISAVADVFAARAGVRPTWAGTAAARGDDAEAAAAAASAAADLVDLVLQPCDACRGHVWEKRCGRGWGQMGGHCLKTCSRRVCPPEGHRDFRPTGPGDVGLWTPEMGGGVWAGEDGTTRVLPPLSWTEGAFDRVDTDGVDDVAWTMSPLALGPLPPSSRGELRPSVLITATPGVTAEPPPRSLVSLPPRLGPGPGGPRDRDAPLPPGFADPASLLPADVDARIRWVLLAPAARVGPPPPGNAAVGAPGWVLSTNPDDPDSVASRSPQDAASALRSSPDGRFDAGIFLVACRASWRCGKGGGRWAGGVPPVSLNLDQRARLERALPWLPRWLPSGSHLATAADPSAGLDPDGGEEDLGAAPSLGPSRGPSLGHPTRLGLGRHATLPPLPPPAAPPAGSAFGAPPPDEWGALGADADLEAPWSSEDEGESGGSDADPAADPAVESRVVALLARCRGARPDPGVRLPLGGDGGESELDAAHVGVDGSAATFNAHSFVQALRNSLVGGGGRGGRGGGGGGRAAEARAGGSAVEGGSESDETLGGTTSEEDGGGGGATGAGACADAGAAVGGVWLTARQRRHLLRGLPWLRAMTRVWRGDVVAGTAATAALGGSTAELAPAPPCTQVPEAGRSLPAALLACGLAAAPPSHGGPSRPVPPSPALLRRAGLGLGSSLRGRGGRWAGRGIASTPNKRTSHPTSVGDIRGTVADPSELAVTTAVPDRGDGIPPCRVCAGGKENWARRCGMPPHPETGHARCRRGCLAAPSCEAEWPGTGGLPEADAAEGTRPRGLGRSRAHLVWSEGRARLVVGPSPAADGTGGGDSHGGGDGAVRVRLLLTPPGAILTWGPGKGACPGPSLGSDRGRGIKRGRGSTTRAARPLLAAPDPNDPAALAFARAIAAIPRTAGKLQRCGRCSACHPSRAAHHQACRRRDITHPPPRHLERWAPGDPLDRPPPGLEIVRRRRKGTGPAGAGTTAVTVARRAREEARADKINVVAAGGRARLLLAGLEGDDGEDKGRTIRLVWRPTAGGAKRRRAANSDGDTDEVGYGGSAAVPQKMTREARELARAERARRAKARTGGVSGVGSGARHRGTGAGAPAPTPRSLASRAAVRVASLWRSRGAGDSDDDEVLDSPDASDARSASPSGSDSDDDDDSRSASDDLSDDDDAPGRRRRGRLAGTGSNLRPSGYTARARTPPADNPALTASEAVWHRLRWLAAACPREAPSSTVLYVVPPWSFAPADCREPVGGAEGWLERAAAAEAAAAKAEEARGGADAADPPAVGPPPASADTDGELPPYRPPAAGFNAYAFLYNCKGSFVPYTRNTRLTETQRRFALVACRAWLPDLIDEWRQPGKTPRKRGRWAEREGRALALTAEGSVAVVAPSVARRSDIARDAASDARLRPPRQAGRDGAWWALLPTSPRRRGDTVAGTNKGQMGRAGPARQRRGRRRGRGSDSDEEDASGPLSDGNTEPSSVTQDGTLASDDDSDEDDSGCGVSATPRSDRAARLAARQVAPQARAVPPGRRRAGVGDRRASPPVRRTQAPRRGAAGSKAAAVAAPASALPSARLRKRSRPVRAVSTGSDDESFSEADAETDSEVEAEASRPRRRARPAPTPAAAAATRVLPARKGRSKAAARLVESEIKGRRWG